MIYEHPMLALKDTRHELEALRDIFSNIHQKALNRAKRYVNAEKYNRIANKMSCKIAKLDAEIKDYDINS